MLEQKIASYIRTYLYPSETFIYEEIQHITRWKVIVLASEVIHAHLFPYPGILTPGEKKNVDFPFINTIKERKFFNRVIKEHDIQAIHAWFAWSGMRILPVCHSAKIPLITSFHGQDVSRFVHQIPYRHKLQQLFRRGDLFLVRCEAMKKDIVALGCPPEKIIVHYGGINLNKFKPKNREKGRKNSVRILMCGRMVEKKGFSYGIRAFSKIVEKHPEASLSIIGEGRFKKRLVKLVRTLKIKDKVKFWGTLPHPRVQKQMREADIFLSPNVISRNKDKEGIPNVIKEAMATALPVISTYHAGIPELVIDAETGFLVPEKDVEALAQRLNYLLSHPQLWSKMGKNARKVVKEKFNLFRQVKELEDIYSKSIK